MFKIESGSPLDTDVSIHATAEETMAAVNTLRVKGVSDFVITDGDGQKLTERQLAMRVMENRVGEKRPQPSTSEGEPGNEPLV